MSVSELVRVEAGSAGQSSTAEWRAGMQSIAPGLDIESHENVWGQVSRFDFAGAKIWFLRSSGAQTMRRIRPIPGGGCRPMAIVQIEGSQTVSQLGRQCEINEGSFTFIDSAAPHSLKHTGSSRHLVMQFPKTTFLPAILHKAVTIRADSHSPMDQPFYQCVDSLWSAAGHMHPLQHVAAFRALVSLAQLTSPICAASSVEDVPLRVVRAMEFIEANLGEPWLCPQAVADAQQVSRRYLDALFETQGQRVQTWIWERRLQRAAEELSVDDESRTKFSKSILQLSLELGFKTPSHFSRTFAKRFGMSPREFKHKAYIERLRG